MINVKSLVSYQHFPTVLSLGRLIYDFLSEDNQCFRQINYSIASKDSYLGWLYKWFSLPLKETQTDMLWNAHAVIVIARGDAGHYGHFPYWKCFRLHFRPYGKWVDFPPNHIDAILNVQKCKLHHSCGRCSGFPDLLFLPWVSLWTFSRVVYVDGKGWAIHTVAKWFSYW